MSADFMSFVLPLEPAKATDIVEAIEGLQERTGEAPYITSPADLMEAMQGQEGAEVCSSAQLPAIVAFDRWAKDAGWELLDGAAFRHVPADEVKALHRGLQRVLIRSGGAQGAAAGFAKVLDRWGNGEQDAIAVVDAVDTGLRAAIARSLDVLIAGSVA